MSVEDLYDAGVFDVDVVQLDGNAAVILRGELDMATAPRLERSAAQVAAQLPPKAELVFDLGQLEFIDASGLAVIARLGEELSRRGGGVRVESARSLTYRIFELTGLGGLLRRPAVAEPNGDR